VESMWLLWMYRGMISDACCVRFDLLLLLRARCTVNYPVDDAYWALSSCSVHMRPPAVVLGAVSLVDHPVHILRHHSVKSRQAHSVATGLAYQTRIHARSAFPEVKPMRLKLVHGPIVRKRDCCGFNVPIQRVCLYGAARNGCKFSGAKNHVLIGKLNSILNHQ